MPDRLTILTPDQRLRVFVSSTLRELAPEREAARRAIERLRMAPVMFEIGARPHPPRELYRAYLDQSHIFLGIYWQSYGWVAPGEDVSGLEDEYNLSGDRPKLIYVKAPAPGCEPRLKELLGRIRDDDRVFYKAFSTPRELGRLIGDDLALLLSERFEALQASGRSEQDATPAPARSPSSVPAAPAALVGREREVDELSRLLTLPGVRLVTLTGTGGIGKTRLSLDLAAAIADRFRDGVVFVSLAPLEDPAMVLPTLAHTLGLREEGDTPLDALLHRYLRDRKMLLVLDNFERLLDAAGAVAELLAATSDIVVLATSRAPLRIRGEREYPLEPLALPDPSLAGRPGSGADSAAVRLFVARAGVMDLLERLVEQSLVIGVPGDEARYRFLETIREYAWELLVGAGEGDALRSRHADAFLALAEAADPELRGPDQAAWLERLEAEHDNFRAALAWLLGRPDPVAALRLAGALGRFWWMRSHLREGRGWLERALSVDAGDAGGSGPARAKALHEAGGLAIYQGDYAGAVPLLEESVALHSGSGDSRGVALSTCYLGFGALFGGDFGRAELFFRDSLALSQRHGYEYGVAFTLLGAGLLATFRGDHPGARRAYEESLALHSRLGDAWGASAVRNDLGWLELAEGRYERATGLFREGLRRYQELGDRAQIADTLDGLAAAAAECGRGERAAQLWGAVEAVRGGIAAPRSNPDAVDQERRVSVLRSRMGRDRFKQLWEQGRLMTLDRAIELGLDDGGSAG